VRPRGRSPDLGRRAQTEGTRLPQVGNVLQARSLDTGLSGKPLFVASGVGRPERVFVKARFQTCVAIMAATVGCAQAKGIDTLDPVVVTATRFDLAPEDQPIAAQVITAEDIRSSSALSVSEVLGKLGGVQTRINLTGVPDTPIDLRGYGVTGDQNTLVLVNGQRVSENEGTPARLSSIPIDSIERIEILRGSGAVLYGGGATAGTINIITKSYVEPGFKANVVGFLGSHAYRDLRAGMRYGHGNAGFNLNAQRYENDNYRVNNRAEQDAVNGEFRLGGSENFFAFGFNVDHQKAQLPGERSEAQLSSDRRGASTPGSFATIESQLLTLRGEKRDGNLTLAVDINRRDKKAKSVLVFYDIPYATNTRVDSNSVSPRVRWSYQTGAIEGALTTGFDWTDWSYGTDTFNTDEKGRQRNRAFYFRNETLFPSGTRLTFGARRERVEQVQEEKTIPIAEIRKAPYLSAFEISVQQDLSNEIQAYGRAGKSFRLANVDENRCSFSANPSACSFLNPQRSQDREVGVKWRTGNTRTRISLFENKLNDEIHFNRLVGLFGSNTNLSPTLRRGIELEGKWMLAKTVEISTQYARLQARFREGIYGGIDVTGNNVPAVPKDRFSANFGWQVAAGTRLNFNLVYVGDQIYDNDQANRFRKMPSYGVADIKLSRDFGTWRLAAGVNNLFDEKYYTYGVVNSTYNSFIAYPEDRRNAYVSAEYRF